MADGILWGAMALVVVTLVMRMFRGGKPASGERVSLREIHPYHCVSIESPASACVAARRLEGQRFLASEAPSLPLPGCSSLNCTCVYTHFDDRRHQVRRDRWSSKAQQSPSAEVERRSSGGRRRTDRLYDPAN